MWNLFEYNPNEGNETTMPISPFSTDQVFESHDYLIEWVRNTAFSLGYVIVKKRSKTNENGVMSYITLMCDRGGEYKLKKSTKNTGTKKINCPFELVGSCRKQYGGWILRVVCDEHNHPPAQYMEGHAYARRLKEHEKRLVADLTSQNVAPRNIISIMKERDENNVSTLKTICNFRNKFRSSQNAGKTPMQAFMSILKDKHFLIEYSLNDISNEMENLFFIHPRSLDIWRAFPHVLIIDATYSTNKYNMPFVQIVGVTSTNKTFSIAFAFIVNEKEESYNWVLTCLRSTLENCMHPRVIVTDRDLALMNACQRVFPNAARFLCRWHITENIKKNCRQSITSQNEWDSFRGMWKVLVDSPTRTLYNKNYKKIQSILRRYPRVLSYIDANWLIPYKEKFVSVWIDQHLNFQERTTNRVESQHARLKKYLTPNNYSLEKFIGDIDKFVRSQFAEIYDTFEKSMIFRNQEHNFKCLEELRGSVSLEALNILVEEIQRLYSHQIDYINCGCIVRHSCGLPCACVIAPYLNSGEHIPLDSIDVFWRKLDLKPSVFAEKEDIRCDSELEMFREDFAQQPEPMKKHMLRRLRDFFRPSKTLIKEPAVQKNTRGRPSLKKKQQQKRVDAINQAPARHSSYVTPIPDLNPEPPRQSATFIDLNVEPARHSSFFMGSYEEPIGQYSYQFNLNDEPVDQCSYQFDLNDESIGQCSYQFDLNEEMPTPYDPLLEEIPPVFHPYIKCTQNVDGDGNCGFRAVAVSLGYAENEWLNIRRQLLDELLTSYEYYNKVFVGFNEIHQSLDFFRTDRDAPQAHWMLMPETGILIANKYGVIVQFLSPQGSLTFFPTRRSPREFLVHRVVSFALLRSVHYVMVQLAEECPMPPISAIWKLHKDKSASEWETMYQPRLDFYKQLRPTKTSFMTLSD